MALQVAAFTPFVVVVLNDVEASETLDELVPQSGWELLPNSANISIGVAPTSTTPTDLLYVDPSRLQRLHQV